VNRIDALWQVIDLASGKKAINDDDPEALALVKEMLDEVQAEESEVKHAIKVLHRNGMVPLVWGEIEAGLDPVVAEAKAKDMIFWWEELTTDAFYSDVSEALDMIAEKMGDHAA